MNQKRNLKPPIINPKTGLEVMKNILISVSYIPGLSKSLEESTAIPMHK